MTVLCVTGYGSLDYAVTLDGFAHADKTTLIKTRDAMAWPRCGGCPTYVARAAVDAGQRAHVISWMGDNAEGSRFCSCLSAEGIDTTGIELIDALRSPTALLVYQADGSCACLYDPALDGREQLTEGQAALIAQASHLCVSAGPAHLVRPILKARSPTARLYWLTKNDTAAFTPDLRRVLSSEADVVICNSAERSLIDATLGVEIIVETRGRDGVVVSYGDREVIIDVAPVTASDTTGAGDTFAGAFIAAEMHGVDDPAAAAERAVMATAAFLRQRGTGDAS